VSREKGKGLLSCTSVYFLQAAGRTRFTNRGFVPAGRDSPFKTAKVPYGGMGGTVFGIAGTLRKMPSKCP